MTPVNAAHGTPTSQKDVAGEQYWSAEWRGEFDRRPEDERDRGWRNHVAQRFDALLQQYVPREVKPGRPLSVTEIGCARSRWLPYFARRFGAEVTGLDYSALGCEQARTVLAASAVDGRIVNGDLFNPPQDMLGTADIAYSWGLVEHFENTSDVIAALTRYVRPGGLLITIIPNMAGGLGAIQRWVNLRVYKLHVPIDREQLVAAFSAREGELLCCEYFLSCNFWAVNPGKDADAPQGLFKRLALRVLGVVTAAVWFVERGLRVRLPATRALSPYIVSVWRVGPNRTTSASC